MERERRANGGRGSFDCSPIMEPSSPPGGSNGGLGYIQHPVSKFDTLPGVAIRYGVEVADIKRMNGLVSDLQMFARKTLQIPLPGRHPPSPIVSNGHDTQGPSSSGQTPSRHPYNDFFGSFQSLRLKSPSSSRPKVSPATSCLQKAASEGFEMALFRRGESHYLEDGPFVKLSPHSDPPMGLHRKCKSVANDMSKNGVKENGSDLRFEKVARRRQKSETDFILHTPEVLLKEDNSSGGGGFSALGNGLALRPKSASRTLVGPDNEATPMNPTIPIGLNDALVNAESANAVRKSSSTPSFQGKWNLKPDFQAISTASIAKPIFDSFFSTQKLKK